MVLARDASYVKSVGRWVCLFSILYRTGIGQWDNVKDGRILANMEVVFRYLYMYIGWLE